MIRAAVFIIAFYNGAYCKITAIALFYGPVLLTFQVHEETIVEGNAANILKNISKQGNSMLFTLKNNGKEYTLVPFYKVTNESYGVYATIRNEC